MESRRSNPLERLVIWGVRCDARNTDRFDALEAAFSSLKVKELDVQLLEEVNAEDKKRLLEAIKKNYTIQSMEITLIFDEDWDEGRNGYPLFRDARRAQLDFFLNRNCKLAEWTANPKLVPRELLSYAMILALKAGINPLFQGLVALSGQGIGLKQKGRKRKHPPFS